MERSAHQDAPRSPENQFSETPNINTASGWRTRLLVFLGNARLIPKPKSVSRWADNQESGDQERSSCGSAQAEPIKAITKIDMTLDFDIWGPLGPWGWVQQPLDNSSLGGQAGKCILERCDRCSTKSCPGPMLWYMPLQIWVDPAQIHPRKFLSDLLEGQVSAA